MSYYLNNKVFDFFDIDKTISDDCVLVDAENALEIFNNESITFDLSKLFVIPSDKNVSNSDIIETTKIVIDWGDGKIDKLNKPLKE
jgi:hypothetical protein